MGAVRAQLASPAAQAAMLRRMHAAAQAADLSERLGAMSRMLGGARLQFHLGRIVGSRCPGRERQLGRRVGEQLLDI